MSAASAAWNAAHPEKMREASARWREKNREKAKASCRAWNAENTDRLRELNASWRAKNPERRREITRAFHKRNPGAAAVHSNKRRAAKLNATPPWVDHDAIKAIYVEAALRGLSVDHIHPLIHPRLCGLHVPWNLQLMPRNENSAKGNRLPTEIM